jgi:catechol 2,3-dioxygenase-like lactoylglutathione lyase family enzyme
MEITGLNHLTFSVSNLDQSFNFYKEVLGFSPKLKWNEGAYFTAGEMWLCLSLDKKTRTAELEEYTHTAFDVSEELFEKISNRIIESNAKIFKTNKSEGNSLYFLDPDGHKLEIHSGTLESRLNEYRKEKKTGFTFY